MTSINSNSRQIILEEIEEEDHDKLLRSSRLVKPRKSLIINKFLWTSDDLDDLKYITCTEDILYENEDEKDIL